MLCCGQPRSIRPIGAVHNGKATYATAAFFLSQASLHRPSGLVGVDRRRAAPIYFFPRVHAALAFLPCDAYRVTFTHPSRIPAYLVRADSRLMNRRLPRPEDVSRHHIDATIMGFLKREKDADWSQVSLVTLHPREEIRVVLKENLERYGAVHDSRFRELVARLKFQGVSLREEAT